MPLWPVHHEEICRGRRSQAPVSGERILLSCGFMKGVIIPAWAFLQASLCDPLTWEQLLINKHEGVVPVSVSTRAVFIKTGSSLLLWSDLPDPCGWMIFSVCSIKNQIYFKKFYSIMDYQKFAIFTKSYLTITAGSEDTMCFFSVYEVYIIASCHHPHRTLLLFVIWVWQHRQSKI